MSAMQSTDTQPPRPKITLPVEGMTCAACQANVQRALTAAPGVTKAAVNLMMHEATVEFDPPGHRSAERWSTPSTTPATYRASRPRVGRSTMTREQTQAREYHDAASKAVVSLVLGAIAMLSLDAADGRGVSRMPAIR